MKMQLKIFLWMTTLTTSALAHTFHVGTNFHSDELQKQANRFNAPKQVVSEQQKVGSNRYLDVLLKQSNGITLSTPKQVVFEQQKDNLFYKQGTNFGGHGAVTDHAVKDSSYKKTDFVYDSKAQSSKHIFAPPRKFRAGVNCDRDCTLHREPYVCYFNFVLEEYSSMNPACNSCTPSANYTNYMFNDCQCIQADGFDRIIMVVNRMLPGPGICVCVGDTLVVDVKSQMQGREASIHWHGIHQRGSQYYDGVPFVTQCPIVAGTIFRYEFMLDEPGSFWWHSHSGFQVYNGLAGALIVREPDKNNPHAGLYDVDTYQQIIFIQDWIHEIADDRFPGTTEHDPSVVPDNFLINGKGVYLDRESGNVTTTPLARFTVQKGKRYRFRLLNAFSSLCPAQLTIEGHNLTLIAMDGRLVVPTPATTITSLAEERYDFIIEANNTIGAYWIQLKGLGTITCAPREVHQLAVLQYEGTEAESMPITPRPTYNNSLPTPVIINPVDVNCSNQNLCVTEIRNNNPYEEVIDREPDATYYIPLDVITINETEFYNVGEYLTHQVARGEPAIALMNNIQFLLPTSPILSQFDYLDPKSFCDYRNCSNATGGVCQCTQVLKVPLGQIIDFVLVDTGIGGAGVLHPIHMHGNPFYVMDVGNNNTLGVANITVAAVKEAIESKKIMKGYKREKGIPPVKDTIGLPEAGYAVVRLRADNPGFWLIHCHIEMHRKTGMDMILWVGEWSDFPPVPKNFPKCGNFVNRIEALN